MRGIGENAGSVETFFFWDKEDIDENSYNGIYSVLFGAPYGDVTQENYLASALLFDPENRSLAVSSILNNAYSFPGFSIFWKKWFSQFSSCEHVTRSSKLRFF